MITIINAISIHTMIVLVFLFAILLSALGSKRISLLIFAALLIGPMIIAPIVLLLSYLNIHVVWLFAICICIIFISLYFSIDFPLTADLRNKEYIDWISMGNKVAEIMKDKAVKSEFDTYWIGDGVAVEPPKKITKLQEMINRISYFIEEDVKYYYALIKNYFKWTFSSRGDLGFYGEIFGKPDVVRLPYAKSDQICEDVLILVNSMNLRNDIYFRYLISIGLFYLSVYIIADEINQLNWEFFLWPTAFLTIFGVLFHNILWRYLGGTNAKIQLFRKYQEKLFSDGNIIGFTVDKKINNSSRQGKISIKVIKYSPHDIGEGLIQNSDNDSYLVIEPNHNFNSLVILLSIVKNEKKFQRWLEIFGNKKSPQKS